jgi:hypothetical protein
LQTSSSDQTQFSDLPSFYPFMPLSEQNGWIDFQQDQFAEVPFNETYADDF